jgi:hypothetical protein
MYNHNSNIIQLGWKCPECGAVMAPWQNTCVNHHGNDNPQITNAPNTTTTIPNISLDAISCNSNNLDVTLTSHNKLSESLKINHITT